MVWFSAALAFSGARLEAQTPRQIQLGPSNAVLSRGFTQITSVRELSDGRVLIADRLENVLAVADSSFRTVRFLGSVGDGPAEYRGVGWLYPIGRDSTLLTDWQSRRWHVLDAAAFSGQAPAAGRLTVVFDPILAGASAQGHVLGRVPARSVNRDPPPGRTDSVALILADRASQRLDTIARLRGPGPLAVSRGARGASISENPLRSEDLALLFRDGWVAIVLSNPYQVRWRRPDGSFVDGQPLPFARVPVTRREKCAALQKRFGTIPRECDPAVVADWPETMPPFLPIASRTMSAPASATLMETPGGGLLIRRTPTAASAMNRYDLVDRRAQPIGFLMIPANEAVIGFGAKSVYIIRTDHDDLQQLRRHPWQ